MKKDYIFSKKIRVEVYILAVSLKHDLIKHGWTRLLLLSVGCGMFALVEVCV